MSIIEGIQADLKIAFLFVQKAMRRLDGAASTYKVGVVLTALTCAEEMLLWTTQLIEMVGITRENTPSPPKPPPVDPAAN